MATKKATAKGKDRGGAPAAKRNSTKRQDGGKRSKTARRGGGGNDFGNASRAGAGKTAKRGGGGNEAGNGRTKARAVGVRSKSSKKAKTAGGDVGNG
jgi:hypothetical protein